MKQLTLIRHAKSSWTDEGLPDVDRPLNSRGKIDAPSMGRRLAEAGFSPDIVLSSPAKRARRTARAIIHELRKKPELVIEPSLYMADSDEMTDLLKRLGDSISHVALVGHNPGMTELANLLSEIAIENVPTTGVVRFELAIDHWSELAPDRAHLIDFDYPKKPR